MFKSKIIIIRCPTLVVEPVIERYLTSYFVTSPVILPNVHIIVLVILYRKAKLVSGKLGKSHRTERRSRLVLKKNSIKYGHSG